jgi:dTDP-4-dehydrorhamnose reductase
MSWHEFAVRAIGAYTGSSPSIEPIRTEDWPTPAARPRYSVLGMAKLNGLGVEPMRPVDAALAEFCARLETP